MFGGNAGNPPTRRKSIRKPKVQKGKVHVIDGKKIKSYKLPERIIPQSTQSFLSAKF